MNFKRKESHSSRWLVFTKMLWAKQTYFGRQFDTTGRYYSVFVALQIVWASSSEMFSKQINAIQQYVCATKTSKHGEDDGKDFEDDVAVPSDACICIGEVLALCLNLSIVQ